MFFLLLVVVVVVIKMIQQDGFWGLIYKFVQTHCQTTYSYSSGTLLIQSLANGPKKFGHTNRVAILTRFFHS